MSESPFLFTRPLLTLEGARVILEAAKQKAKEVGVDMDIAVVDGGGHLIAFERMDAAKITGIDIAVNKAFTAACTRKATSQYAKMAGPGGEAFGIHASNQGRFMVFGGGVPVVWNNEVVGAVGCSSGSAAQDEAVASAGIEALLEALKA